MTQIKTSELVHHSPEILFKNTHREDIAQVFAFSNYWVKYFSSLPDERKAHARATIYLRMLTAANIYNWMMIEYADTIINGEGQILYGLTLVTNIAHIKKGGLLWWVY